ncbi:hypothetical protein PRZ48_000526 [Zasmidium cellare]|uniref:Uncharacterized protein n=1 Tax=Zasmidium cellare TaxID=395010 RepID=A0ABR0F000_ZASCE|nr:hypothetical protein PRZ48_000526 [Zasmidium cellare]
MASLANLLDKFNLRIPFGRWQLFEFADLWIVPPFIKHDQQDALAARWTKKLALLQEHTPAELLADIIDTTLSALTTASPSSNWTVVDFGSGTGGPLPILDTLVNHGRTELGHPTIQFLLSDLHPHLDSWMTHASRSETLSFVPQAVDAAYPPFSVISSTTKGDKEAAYMAGLESNGTKVFRTFCSTFHHFDDESAGKVLKSSLETSDGFFVVELQERTVFGLGMVLLENLLLLLMAVFWFWNDPVHLFFTYCVPILPVTQCADGLVTCLRIRSFDEVLRLLPKQYGYSRDKIKVEKDGEVVELRDWQFKHLRVLHTWPFGYMNVIVGTCTSSKDGIH